MNIDRYNALLTAMVKGCVQDGMTITDELLTELQEIARRNTEGQ